MTDLFKDLFHHLMKRPPLWSDAFPCHRRFCRFCGGRKRADINSVFIRLSKKGLCMGLIYDDNGKWAVTDRAYGTMRLSEKDDCSVQYFAKAEEFEDTPVEALLEYLRREELEYKRED